MDINKLKIVAGKIVIESKLPKDAKHQLLNFIQHEASEYQLKLLLLDGKVDNLSEEGKQIVNDRFELQESELDKLFRILMFKIT
jgi:hypothetical protein